MDKEKQIKKNSFAHWKYSNFVRKNWRMHVRQAGGEVVAADSND